MPEILILISWVLVTALIGWSALSLMIRRKMLFSLTETAGLSFPVGLGLVSIQMACFSALRIEWRASCILLCWVPVFFAALYIAKGRRGGLNLPYDLRDKDIAGKEKRPFSIFETLLISSISFQVIYAFFKSLIKPIESYDAIAIYSLMAKIFYMAKAIPSDFYSTFKDFVPHIEYPLLLPISESYFYTFFGSLNDILVKTIFPMFFVCLLAVFYRILRHKLKRKSALLFTFLLATIPQLAEGSTNGYADILLTFYYSASLFYLYMWTQGREGAFLAVSFILSVLAAWTKTEGLMLAAINLLIALIYIIRKPKGMLKGLSYCILLSASMIGYLLLKKMMGLELHGDFSGLALSDAGKILCDAVKRIPAILYEYQIQFFGPKRWNIVWIIFLFLFIIRFKKAFNENLFFLTSAIMLIFCGYTAIYMVMPRDIDWHLSTTACRFFMHFIPVVALWIAVSYKDMKL